MLFRLEVSDFGLFRDRLHDKIYYRRRHVAGWTDFAVIGRYAADQQVVFGVACIAQVGHTGFTEVVKADSAELMAASAGPNDLARHLYRGSSHGAFGSIKSAFVTQLPVQRTRAVKFHEPMPMLL